jgi:cellulose synthase/poly-beta-1,6-N-acetylglucosamine synthase-like glycosyltransferase
MNARPWHMSVLIPARNEEALLPRCLKSVFESCDALRGLATVDVVVAIDSSWDRTHEIARGMLIGRGAVVETQASVVGVARALAARASLERYRGRRDRCWLANTDADSVVSKTWLTAQLSFARQNIEALAGTVEVDNFEEHGPCAAERFHASYLLRRNGSHDHVHGANFGVRADVYIRAGGWRNTPSAEDHDLWRRLGKLGTRRLSVNCIRVMTSGRKIGRAPRGFAAALAATCDGTAA